MVDAEFNMLRRLSELNAFRGSVSILQARYSTWAFSFFCDDMIEMYGLECQEGPDHLSVVLFEHKTRRKRPAFIYVHRERASRFDWTVHSGHLAYSIEVIEAGKYVLAGEGAYAEPRAKAEGGAL